MLLEFLFLWIFSLTVTVTSAHSISVSDALHSIHQQHPAEQIINESVLVIALCFLHWFLALFVLVFQVVLEFLGSVQILHTLPTYAFLCLVTVCFI